MTTERATHRTHPTKKETRAGAKAALAMMAVIPLLSMPFEGCSDATDAAPQTSGTMPVRLTIQTRSTGEDTSVETGTTWENYMDFSGGDYRIYFFTNDTSNEAQNTLVGELQSVSVVSDAGEGYATYDVVGNVSEDLLGYDAIKVVVLANWGKDNYPDVELNKTTIDGLCNQTFSAFVDSEAYDEGAGTATLPSYGLHIPFYGVQSYTGVTWKEGIQTHLTTPIDMLRAVAKLEVKAEGGLEFRDVSVVGYNGQGFCAPKGVYTETAKYDDNLHLANGQNDTNALDHTMHLTQQEDGTWVGYLTEYSNMGTDYSYIRATATIGEEETTKLIYFAEYNDQTTTAYGEGEEETKADRHNIVRNWLYRFTVTPSTQTNSTNTDITPYTTTRTNTTAPSTPTFAIKAEHQELR